MRDAEVEVSDVRNVWNQSLLVFDREVLVFVESEAEGGQAEERGVESFAKTGQSLSGCAYELDTMQAQSGNRFVPI